MNKLLTKSLKTILAALPLSVGLIAPTAAMAATLSLSPASGTFGAGCTVTLKVNLDTAGAQTDGTDAVLLFDANKLTPAQTAIQNGSIYPDYSNVVDAQNGKLTISGIASVSQPFVGSGTLATVTFTVNNGASAGPFQVKFDYDQNNKSKTTDSNVVERGTVAELLSGVTDGNYTIGSGGCSGASSSTGGVGSAGNGSIAGKTGAPGAGAVGSGTYFAGGSSQSGQLVDQPVTQLGSAGAFENTVILAVAGGIFILLGIIGLAIL